MSGVAIHNRSNSNDWSNYGNGPIGGLEHTLGAGAAGDVDSQTWNTYEDAFASYTQNNADALAADKDASDLFEKYEAKNKEAMQYPADSSERVVLMAEADGILKEHEKKLQEAEGFVDAAANDLAQMKALYEQENPDAGTPNDPFANDPDVQNAKNIWNDFAINGTQNQQLADLLADMQSGKFNMMKCMAIIFACAEVSGQVVQAKVAKFAERSAAAKEAVTLSNALADASSAMTSANPPIQPVGDMAAAFKQAFGNPGDPELSAKLKPLADILQKDYPKEWETLSAGKFDMTNPANREAFNTALDGFVQKLEMKMSSLGITGITKITYGTITQKDKDGKEVTVKYAIFGPDQINSMIKSLEPATNLGTLTPAEGVELQSLTTQLNAMLETAKKTGEMGNQALSSMSHVQ